MTKFRMIRTGLWIDRDFLSVSPDAKLIYMFLMSGPHSTNVNGLSITPIDRVSIGCAYGIDRVSMGYQELKRKGLMLHDEEFDVVFLPREILENPPGSWQQMDGYMKTLEEFPDCFIRNEVFEILKDIADSSKSERMREVYRYGIDRVSIGYRYKYKEKYKEKIKEEEKVKEISFFEAKKENTEKNELQLLPNPASPPSVIDCVADGKKKSSKSGQSKKDDEEKIYRIRKCYESLWLKMKPGAEEKDLPLWDSPERAICRKLIVNPGVEQTIELLGYYMNWNNAAVIHTGRSFVRGNVSFWSKLTELKADIVNPERRKIAQFLAFKEKTDHIELKQQNEIAEMTKMAEEYKARQERLKML